MIYFSTSLTIARTLLFCTSGRRLCNSLVTRLTNSLAMDESKWDEFDRNLQEKQVSFRINSTHRRRSKSKVTVMFEVYSLDRPIRFWIFTFLLMKRDCSIRCRTISVRRSVLNYHQVRFNDSLKVVRFLHEFAIFTSICYSIQFCYQSQQQMNSKWKCSFWKMDIL